MEKEKSCKSDNGINIYSYKNPSLSGFYISLFVKAGCMYESREQVGITHFFEHAAIRNVNALMNGRLYSELDKHGVEFNASTYSEMVQFYVSGASEHFDFGASLISMLLSAIVLKRSDIDAERRRIKAEIRESDDKNTLTSFTNKIVFEGTSLASSIVGTNASVDKITAAKLEAYRKQIFTKDNIFFYVTGNFGDSDIEQLARLISAYEIDEGEKRENLAPVPDSFGKRDAGVYIKNADFTMVRFTFDLDMEKVSVVESDLLYDILLSGYNSKLFIEMSEKRGLFYDTGGAAERYSNIGTLYFSYEVKERQLYESLELVTGILASLKQQPLLPDECMKAGYVDNAYMLYDDCRELNFSFAYDNHVMGLGYSSIADRREAYRSVSAEQLKEAACRIFRPENLTLTLKADKKRVEVEKIKNIIERNLG